MVPFSIKRGIWFLFLYKEVYMVPFSILWVIWFLFLLKGVYIIHKIELNLACKTKNYFEMTEPLKFFKVPTDPCKVSRRAK